MFNNICCQHPVIATAVLAVLVIFILAVITRNTRKRHVHQLVANTPGGKVQIRQTAAIQVVNRVLKEYPAIGASKVAFSQERKGYRIGIHCEFAIDSDRELSEILPELEAKLKNEFKTRFALDKIAGVRITINKLFSGDKA